MPPTVPSDAALVARVPDPGAVRALYARHGEAVVRFAIRRCRCPEDVADLVSTVFLEMFSAARSYDARHADARPWLLGIAARSLADLQRGDYRRRELAQRLGAFPAFAEEEYDRVEQMLDAARLSPSVDRALSERLTAAERELFLLVAADGLSVAEAGRALGTSPVAARMRLTRARRKLRAALAQGAPDTGELEPVGRQR